MHNIIFSLNAIIPIFIIIFLGYFLRKNNVINDNFISISTVLVFNVALPALVFKDIAGTDFKTIFDVRLILFAVTGTIVYLLILFASSSVFIENKKARGAFIQGAFRGNYAILGIALASNLFGQQGIIKSTVLLAFIIPLYNVLAIIVLACTSPGKSKNNFNRTIKSILKNPLIIAIVLAVLFSYFRIRLPEVAIKTIDYISSLAIPMALLGMGGAFNFSAARKNLSLSLVGSTLKIVISPAVFTSLAYILGFRGVELGVLFILFASPTALTSHIMAIAMDSDRDLATNIIMITTLGSIFTILFGVFALKSFGAI